MAVGLPLKTTYADGDVYSASDVNDTNGTINANVNPYTAGKNRIINGDFGVWQRGTSAFTADGVFTADRFSFSQGSTSGAQVTQGTFTPAELTVAGGTTNFYMNIAGTMTSASGGYIQVQQPIENVRTFQNSTVTVSFYAKGTTAGSINILFRQNFGSGGSSEVLTTPVNFSITTSWARYSTTISIPSVSGKTIGANSALTLTIVKNMGTSYPTFGTSNYTGTLSLWGVQVEAGSTATAFQTATGTIQGELAACQRYYWRTTVGADCLTGFQGAAYSTTGAYGIMNSKVTMRTTPTSVDYSNIRLTDGTTNFTITGLALWNIGTESAIGLLGTGASGLTQFRPYAFNATASGGYVGISAEL